VAESNEANNAVALAVTLPSRPDLQVSSASIGSIVVNQNGTYTIPVTYTVTNAGGSAAQPSWYDLAYLSTDATLDNSDVNLSGFANHGSALAAGGSYTATTNFTASAATAPGAYTLFIKTDAHGSTVGGTNTDNGNLVESNESNNAASLSVTLPAKPDLQISNASIGAVTHNANGSYSFPITYTVTNAGGSPAQPGWYDIAFLSTDTTLSTNDVNLSGWSSRSTVLGVGASYTNTVTFTTTASTAAGSYTVFIKTDGHGPTVSAGTSTDGGNVAESDETNNVAALSVVLP
jgi:galactitol-specific phosphotransferase system IIB component